MIIPDNSESSPSDRLPSNPRLRDAARVEQLVNALVDELERGEHLDLERFLHEHEVAWTDLESLVRDFIDTWEGLRSLARSQRDRL